jgi:hypothetical protein
MSWLVCLSLIVAFLFTSGLFLPAAVASILESSGNSLTASDTALLYSLFISDSTALARRALYNFIIVYLFHLHPHRHVVLYERDDVTYRVSGSIATRIDFGDGHGPARFEYVATLSAFVALGLFMRSP